MMKKETLSESVYLKLKENLFEMTREILSASESMLQIWRQLYSYAGCFHRLHEEGC